MLTINITFEITNLAKIRRYGKIAFGPNKDPK
jgi:hypothetical protein